MKTQRLHRIERVVRQRQSGIIVVLEDIHDPHNAAAILRTCDGLGIQNVYFIFEKEKRYNPKTVGKATSSSANKWLDFQIFDSTSQCITELRQKGYTVIVTALYDRAETLEVAKFSEKKIAVVVGNERNGVSEDAIKLADRVIMIPMKGFVQSLNVSVATAIVLWEITKQSGDQALFSTKERSKLLKEFVTRSKE